MSNRLGFVLMYLLILSSCRDRDEHTSDSSAGHTASVVAHGVTTRITAPVTEHGIAPLQVGMTVAQARSALGMFDVSAAAESGCGYATAAGLPPGVSVMVERGTVARIDVDSSSVATAEGARVGDSEQRIRALYGGRVVVSPHKYTDGHYLTVTPVTRSDSLYRIVFETNGGLVATYRAGRLPSVAYVERCG